MLQAADAAAAATAANVSAVLADDDGGGGDDGFSGGGCSVRGGNELEQLTAIANRCEKVHGCEGTETVPLVSD